MEVEPKKLDAITDDIRDIVNWIKVFENEYNLPEEVVSQLRERLEGIVSKIREL